MDTGPLAAYLFDRQSRHRAYQPPGFAATRWPPASWSMVRSSNTSAVYPVHRRQRQLRDLPRGIYPYFLTYPILERYADIRRQLRKPQGPGLIGDIDTLIAATALESDLAIVTLDNAFESPPFSSRL